MTPLADNPFATLTVIVAPAILTNASSVLCLGTGNRIGRVVDRTRAVKAAQARLAPDDTLRGAYQAQLDHLHVRARMLLQALRCFYTSIGAFAAASLISIIGAGILGSYESLFLAGAALALVAGTIGVGGLVVGCGIMVQEVRLAVRVLEAEAGLAPASGQG
jgi:hypothetical protein